MEIPRHITSLTGITNDDVSEAPRFEEVASDVQELLNNRIFVAQNVNFDYSFIKNEFERIGIPFQSKRLCTSRYSRSRINGLKRSSLKALAEYFGVINENPHRALSDALTAAKILIHLLKIDEDLEIAGKLVNQQKTKVTLPNNIEPDDFYKLPSRPGVYHFLGEGGKPIYIGKAKNLKSRVSSHFNGSLSSKRTQTFLREIFAIRYTETGSDLLAYLLEDTLIRKHWPKHNSAQKARVKKFGVIHYQDQNGNYRLAVNPVKQEKSALKIFYFYSSAMQWLHEITVENQLNPEYVGLLSLTEDISVTDQSHNASIKKLLEITNQESETQFIQSKGRTKEETAWIAVKNNTAIGFIFLPHGMEPKLDACEPLQPSATSSKVLENYLQKEESVTLITT